MTVPDAHSIALSVADPLTGRHALAAMHRWGGDTVSVREDAIVQAVRSLAGRGLLAEPASAVALAGLWELRDTGRLAAGHPVVLVLTRSYVIQGMRMLAVTWTNDTRGMSVFWLHAVVRHGIWPSVDDQLGITPRGSSDSSGYIFET